MNPVPPLFTDRTSYSFDWALGIVRGLHKKHTRATDILCEALLFNEEKLALVLATRPLAWDILRQEIKWVSRQLTLKPEFLYTSDLVISDLKLLAKKRMHPDLYDFLDRLTGGKV